MYFWWRWVKSRHLELDRYAVHNDRYKSYRPGGRLGGPRNDEEEDDDDPAALMLMATGPRSNSSSGLLSGNHRTNSLSTVTAITGSPNRLGGRLRPGGVDPRSASRNITFGLVNNKRSNEDDELDDDFDEYNQYN